MVLIIKKIRGKRCDVILIPKRPLNDMLERHVDRIDLVRSRPNTCIVKEDGISKLSHGQAIKLLLETLQRQRILEGERRYPIPHHLFEDLICRDFEWPGRPIGGTFEGDFKINFIRVKGEGKKAISEAQSYESLNMFEIIKIKNTFRGIGGRCEKVFVFLAHHIYPARRR